MNEVSPLAFAVLRTVAVEIQMPLDELSEGLVDLAVAEKEGSGWAPFCEMSNRLMDRCGGPDALARQGALAMRVPELGPIIRILRMFAGTRELYWANVRWGGPSLFPKVTTAFRALPSGRFQITLDVPAGGPSAEGFFEINAGVFMALPRALGLTDARVELTITENRGVFLVDPPPALTFLARVRLFASAVFTSRVLVEQLAAQNEHLTVQSQLAARAQADADAARIRAERALIVAEEQRVAADHARKAAERSRAEAVAALALKSEFVGTISHELRTPLNGILGMTHILLGTRLTAEQQDYMETIASSGSVLLQLINDVLDFSKMEAGKLRLDPMPVDLRALVEDLLQAAASRSGARALDVIGIVHEDVPVSVRVDALRLRQVIANLVDNAVKFTSVGEVVVEIGVSSRPDHLVCSVRDTGIGISPAQRARIFQPFVQADGSTTRQYGGTGLGLTICSKIVDAMDGSIDLQSEAGEGSTFSFEFEAPRLVVVDPAPVQGSVRLRVPPTQHLALTMVLRELGWGVDDDATLEILDAEAFPAAAPPADGVRRVVLTREAGGRPGTLRKPVRRDELSEALSAAATPAPIPVKLKVLVLDEDALQRRIVTRFVKHLGHETIDSGEPDAVVVAWPAVDAESDDPVLTARLRWKSCRVVALAPQPDHDRCVSLGADRTVDRPVNVDDLARALSA